MISRVSSMKSSVKIDDEKEDASGMDVSTTTELQDSQSMVRDLSKSSEQYWFPLNIDGSSPGRTEEPQGPNSSTEDDVSGMNNWKNQSDKRNWLGSDGQEIRRMSTQRASIRSSGVPAPQFGEIEFSGLNQTAKFVRLSNSTPDEKLREILSHKWDLKRPTLIISIFGADFEKKRKLKLIFKKGLLKAAESGCWIITGGFNVGIYRLAGEAVRDYTDAYGGDNMIAFGVNSWGCVARNEVLESSNYDGTYPAIYQTEEDIPNTEGEGEEIPNTGEEEKPLDPNHTHFLLVDTGVPKLKGEEAEFRAKFESIISVYHDEEGETTVPMCGLVVGGDRFTLKQVYMGLIMNQCPVVVTRGTGGAADGLAEAIQIANNDLDEDEEGEEDVLGSKIEAALREAFYEIHPDVERFETEVEMIKEILASRSHLVAVFDMEEDFDLDGFLISSLLSSANTNIPPDQLNLDQLKICLTLNRPDIARDKIFLDNKKYKKGDLNDYMYQALMNDRHEFVKIFLEQGFSLEEFLTVYTLEKLYTDQLKRLNSKVAIFHQLWEYHRSHRNSKKVSLREVGKVIRVLVGDFYHPLYLYKEFQRKLVDQKSPQSVTLKAVRPSPSPTKAMLQSTQTTLAPAYHLCKGASPRASVTNSVVACTGADSTSVATEPKLFSEIQFIDDDESDCSPLRGSPSAQGIDNEITIESESALNIAGEKSKSQELIALRPRGLGVYPLDGKRRPRRKSSLDFVNSLNNSALAASQFCRENNNASMLNNKDTNHEQPGSSWLMSNLGEKVLDPDLDDRAKYVQLDRPARELMLWSILVGKLQMSELFWTMEKEPIAGALLASMLLSSLESKTDDFTDKEDYLNYARHFEEQAEGVLDECYRENEHRAQHLIDRELYYYGTSSVILLSAEGESIRFMAHPCCQDFLNNTWMGKLSPKNGLLRIGVGALCGMCFPFLIPKVVLFKKIEPTKPEKSGATDNAAVELNELSGTDVQFYPGQEKQGQKNRVERTDKLNFRQYVQRIRDFYMSPIMRFLYNTISYICFLFIFCYFLILHFNVNVSWVEGVVIGYIATLLLEEVKQATLSGISFSTYISDGWNKLDCAAVGLFVAGFILRMTASIEYYDNNPIDDERSKRFFILNDTKFIIARIFMAVSLFLFIVRVMYIFSFHMALGPKLIMIWKMVVNDLVPFMVILSVFILGYGVMSHVISYPNNLYTPVNKNSNISKIDNSLELIKLISRPYFQMFGDFSLDDIRGDGTTCTQDGLCPNLTSRWLVPAILGIYVLLTNILMFNLLIAMFSQTYETVEKSSTHYWNYQRYQMISEYVDRSPLAPPLIFIWHIYELIKYIRINCFKKSSEDEEFNPFCKSYKTNRKKERELQKWEHLKAMDFLRNQNEPQGKRGTKGPAHRSDVRAIVARHPQGGVVGAGAAGDLRKEVTEVTEQLNMELEKKFKDIEVQFQRFTDLENRLFEIGNSVTGVSQLITNIVSTQDQINRRINQLPLCQCAEMMEGPDEPEPPQQVVAESVQQASTSQPPQELTEEEKAVLEQEKAKKRKKKLNQLEEAIRRVVESVYQEQPSWVEDATRNAAQSVLENIQIPAPAPVPIAPSPSTPSIHSMASERIVVDRSLPGLLFRKKPPAPPSPSPPPSVNLEEEWAATIEPDDAFAPEVPTPSTGRVIERQSGDHRLYRLAPFNFEKYAGMRMNVPPEKTPWPIDYPDYYAYDASDEVLEYGRNESFDSDEIDVRSISFNQYDVKHSVRRQSLLGRYRIDTRSGLPLNPMGRSGLRGRGLLPRWGPNHAIILILTRWHRDDNGKVIQRNGRPILQYVGLVRNKQQCIPWFITDHQARCDVDSCALKAANGFMQSRLRSVCEVKFAYKNFKSLDNAIIEKVYKGYLDDHLNADNAWIEAVVINYHESEDFEFTDDLLKIFEENNVEEQIRWLEVAYSTALRSSHSDMLKTISQMHKAYF